MDFEQDKPDAEDFVPSHCNYEEPAGNSSERSRPKRRLGWKIFWGITITLSILANMVMFLMLIGMAAFFAVGHDGIGLTEKVIRAGIRTNKIAVITVDGIIDDKQFDSFHNQIETARKDANVKGLIVRVSSPGGAVSSSDRMYNEINKFRSETGMPTAAFMQGVAASGGYYVSVGCDRIIAEPTTITGSIGVIMGHFVLQELLEEKLGIYPVIVKSGEKKDWPSPFKPITEEQKQYLHDKLISPAYERFVGIVAQSRPSLTMDEVRRLADGSIYHAAEALDEKLIDEIGYLNEAIDLVSSLAGIENAHVVEYRKPFSFSDILELQNRSVFKIDKSTLLEFNTPQVLYLWSGN